MATVVAKIGSSSLTDEHGRIARAAIAKLCREVAVLRQAGHRVVVVTSGAVASGVGALGLARPSDLPTLQALSAVGQGRLMRVYDEELAGHGLIGAQVLLTPFDFVHRSQYLHARQTLGRLLELGCVPVVNENDAIANDEIRYGDNDRIAALVANLLGADLLVLLTDIAGLYSADPRLDPTAVLVEEVEEIDAGLEATVGGAGTARGSGGMASKLQAAKIATWSGIDTVIARADRPDVLVEAVAGVRGVGTRFRRSARRLPARKLWIAFATDPAGRILVDAGARTALLERGVSLLPAGVVAVEGTFDAMDPVELAGPDGKAFARGLVSMDDIQLRAVAGKRTAELGDGIPHEVVHRDDLVPTPL